MKKTGKLFILVLLLLSLALVLNNCGSSSSTDPNPNPNPGTCDNIEGTYWQIQTVNASQCGDGTYNESFQVSITQNGCNITVSGGGATLTGTINGSNINWSGSFPEEGGITKITSSNISVSGNKYTGSANWTWSGGGQSCSGTTQLSGTKN